MPFALPPLNVKGSFGAGPSKASNRVGSVSLGGLNVPAYPFRSDSRDFLQSGGTVETAGASALTSREWEMVAAAGALIALVIWRRKGSA